MFLTWTLKQNYITPNSKVYHNVAVIKERPDVDKKDQHIDFKYVISVSQFLSIACFVLQTSRTSKNVKTCPCILLVCTLGTAIGRYCGRWFGCDLCPHSQSYFLITLVNCKCFSNLSSVIAKDIPVTEKQNACRKVLLLRSWCLIPCLFSAQKLLIWFYCTDALLGTAFPHLWIYAWLCDEC